MAIFGRDYYGRARYGSTLLSAEMAVDPFEAEVLGFDTAELSWHEPGGDWSGFLLLRNRSGFPISETDGEVVLDFPVGYSGPTGGSYTDTNLTGGWLYYAIFLWDSGADVWIRAAAVDVLIPYDFSSTEKMWDLTPEWYKEIRDSGAGYDQDKYRINPAIYLNNEDTVPNLTYVKFLHLFGWLYDTLRTQAEYVRDGYDVTRVHVNRLALLAEQFGGEIEESAPAAVNRSLVRNLGLLYRKRGTLDGIREMVSLSTGWEVDVTLGSNLMLSEDQANFTHPWPQDWDETVMYQAGDRVKYNLYLFQALTTAYGAAEGPPSTNTDNTWWSASRFVEPQLDGTVARDDTGDISTWQIEGVQHGVGFVSGETRIGAGAIDPEDGSIHYENALSFRNDTGYTTEDFNLRSIPRHKDNLSSWSTRLIYESGVPVPRARKPYVSGQEYRAGDMVMYEGSPYEALTTTTLDPTNTVVWSRVGYDDRTRLCLSFWSHGPFNGAVNTGGLKMHCLITEFDDSGNMVAETLCNPASFANVYFDPFNAIGVLDGTRTGALGNPWSNTYIGGTWNISRDDNGGFVIPPITAGRSYRLFSPTIADANIALTYRNTPPSGRRLGLIFRYSDASNFWIATQFGVYKIVAGAAAANPATGALTYSGFVAGDRLQVQLNGSLIKAYRNGTFLGQATDSFNSTATQHGVDLEA